MITRLFIQNYAIIEQIEVTFESGLNVITGETGAGKSIAIEALGLALGERGNTDMVRRETDKILVECEAQVSEIKRPVIESLLKTESIPLEYPLILRREVRANGRSRAFINDTPCTVQVLKNVGDELVDMHGQHEHQSLLNAETHITFLDQYANHDDLLETAAQKYAEWVEAQNKFRQLKKKQSDLSEKEDLYKFQLKEIQAIRPEPGEMDELEQQRKIMANSQKIADLVRSLQALLYESETAIYDQLVMAERQLRELAQIDNSVSAYVDECNSASLTVKEIGNFLNHYSGSIEHNPRELDRMEERIVALRKLMKKYGPSLEDVLAYRDKIARMLDEFENYDSELNRLAKARNLAAEELATACETLHNSRIKAAEKFSKETEDVLHSLGMENASFRVKVDYRPTENSRILVEGVPVQVEATGADQVEFFITTNPGEGEKPLAQTASGGEISRTMLAIKSVLAGADGIATVIFDEIDIGISGRISRIVGQQLKKLSQFHQVICITHLPQIASLGNTHFAVGKLVKNERTVTKLRKLEHDERVQEIATLVGGRSLSETTLQNARELLENAEA